MNMEEVKKARDKAAAQIVEVLRELSITTGMRVGVVVTMNGDDGLVGLCDIELKVPA